MMKQKDDDGNPPLSPTSVRRKHGLTRLQSEVMTRARSTLSGIGDVWKSKVNGAPQTPTSISPSSTQSTPPRSPKSQSAVKNTFDFLWPKGRKQESVKEKKKDKRKVHEERQSRSSKRTDGRRFSRNQSVDISELQRRRNREEEEFSRSLEDGIHYLSEDDDDSDRPKSYNETFNFLREYDDYTRNNYDPRGSARKRHILFNDEDDVIFYKTSPSPGKIPPLSKIPTTPQTPPGILSRNPKNGTIPRSTDQSDNNKKPEPKVISARLKIQPPEEHGRQRAQERQERYTEAIKQGSGQTTASRNVSTVIIEEQERDLSHDDGVDSDEGDRRRRRLKKLPSFDLHDFKSDTLPRVKNKRILDLETEERLHRTGSLDLELESQAMRIVRTVGQAFEVCHKLSMDNNSYTDDRSSTSEHERCSPEPLSDLDEIKKDPLPTEQKLQRPNHLDIIPTTHFNFNPPSTPKKNEGTGGDKTPDTPNSREFKQLREQLEQQALQTRQALAQLMLVREQLISETNARIEAQARTQQLMQQNRELLETIAQMGGFQESDRHGLTSGNIGLAPQSPYATLSLGSSATKGSLAALNQSFGGGLGALGALNPLGLNLGLTSLQQLTQPAKLQNQDYLAQQEILNLNQELLNRLSNLNLLGLSPQSAANNNLPSYLFTGGAAAAAAFGSSQTSSTSSQGQTNSNTNVLNTPTVGSTNPSPMSTLNRKSYASSASPLDPNMGEEGATFIRPLSQLSSTAKVARWFNTIQWNNPPPLSRPESGFVSGDSRSEKNDTANKHKNGDDAVDFNSAKDAMPTEEFADEYLLVAGSASLWSKLNVKKRKKLLKLGKVTTF